MGDLGPDHAFWIDGEWISWDSIPEPDDQWPSRLAMLEYEAELAFQFPNADQTLIPHFQDLLALAERFFRDTGKHLQVYGDIGELYGAITYGIRLHKQYAQGSDGKLGRDFVEIKTITPFKRRDKVTVSLAGNFSKLLVVKVNADFKVSGRMIDRKNLAPLKGKRLQVDWEGIRALP